MSMENRVKDILQSSIESTLMLSENMAADISRASERQVQTLLNERKVLVAGNGTSSAIGRILVSNLVNRLDQERPGLPALHLGADSTVISAIANDNSYHDVFHKQIRALGQSGDTLVIISASGKSSNLVHAVAAAHDKELSVIALTGNDGGDITTLLNSNDIELRASGQSLVSIQQSHLLMVYCLCDLIDFQLFGVQQPL